MLFALMVMSWPATALDCDEIVAMSESGIPDELIASTIAEIGTDLLPEDIDCLRAQGASKEVVAAAENVATTSSVEVPAHGASVGGPAEDQTVRSEANGVPPGSGAFVGDQYPAPQAVERWKVEGVHSGYVEFQVKGWKPTFYVSDGKYTSFFCDQTAGKGHTRKLWTAYAEFFDRLAVQSHMTNVDWGDAKTGFWGMSGSNAAGYCNATASSRDGYLMVLFRYNDSCFGSAGCVTEQVVLSFSEAELRRMTSLFRETMP